MYTLIRGLTRVLALNHHTQVFWLQHLLLETHISEQFFKQQMLGKRTGHWILTSPDDCCLGPRLADGCLAPIPCWKNPTP